MENDNMCIALRTPFLLTRAPSRGSARVETILCPGNQERDCTGSRHTRRLDDMYCADAGLIFESVYDVMTICTVLDLF